MKLKYFKETDTLYIELSQIASTESSQIAENIVLDYAKDGSVVGIEIENALHILDMSNFSLEFPTESFLTKQKTVA